jgi:hypothetical protein
MQLYNQPLPRIDLNSINPYLSGKFTKSQLDMRRKAEILKYSPARVSTQTNNLTKKQQFSMLARGTYVQPQQSVLERGNVACAEDNMIMTPTSSCDVPGPVTYLYNDETVPLYNFSSFNTRSYPDYAAPDSTPWQFVSIPNLSIQTGVQETSHYLILYNSVAQPTYTYTITVPVGISVSGTNYANSNARITANVSSATLRSYYNDNLYGTYSNPAFDTNMRHVFDVSNMNPGTFSANSFIGSMTFSGVQLYTSPTFVYSFTTQVDLSVNWTGNGNIGIGSTGLRAIVNMTSGTTNRGSFLTGV